jgi:hypothetical protein
MRYRITIRGDHAELRGYISTPTDEGLRIAAQAVTPIGLMVASPVGEDYDPFAISEPDHPPTIEGSKAVIERFIEEADGDMHTLLESLAVLHNAQALVIRGERYLRERAEAELRDRELRDLDDSRP